MKGKNSSPQTAVPGPTTLEINEAAEFVQKTAARDLALRWREPDAAEALAELLQYASPNACAVAAAVFKAEADEHTRRAELEKLRRRFVAAGKTVAAQILQNVLSAHQPEK